MPEDDLPVRLARIVLRPKIAVTAGPTAARVRHLVELAHRECYIANSLRSEVKVIPEVLFTAPPGTSAEPDAHPPNDDARSENPGN